MCFSVRISWRVIYATLTTSIALLIAGFGYGLPSPIAREVKSGKLLNDYQFGLFSGIFFLTAALSGLLAMPLMHYLGRKAVLLIGAFLSGSGYLVLGSSRIPELLIFGRALTGLGCGLSLSIAPIYIGELAFKKTRGRHLSFIIFGIPVGVLVVYLLGLGLNYDRLSWIGSSICLLQMVLLLFVPYSPTYLLSRDLEKRAFHIVKQIRSQDYDALGEIKEIRDILEEESSTFLSKLSILFKVYHLKAFLVVIVFMVAHQGSAVNLIASYSSELLDSDLINSNITGLIFPIGEIIGSLVSICLIDKLGRKILFIFSNIATILSLALVASYLLINDQICPQLLADSSMNSTGRTFCQSPYLIIWPMFSIAMFGLMFSIGLASLAFISLSELISLKMKKIVTGIAIFILFMTSFLINTLYPIISTSVPRYTILFALVLLNSLLCIYLAIFTPETKGKSVEELESMFKKNTIFCHF